MSRRWTGRSVEGWGVRVRRGGQNVVMRTHYGTRECNQGGRKVRTILRWGSVDIHAMDDWHCAMGCEVTCAPKMAGMEEGYIGRCDDHVQLLEERLGLHAHQTGPMQMTAVA